MCHDGAFPCGVDVDVEGLGEECHHTGREVRAQLDGDDHEVERDSQPECSNLPLARSATPAAGAEVASVVFVRADMCVRCHHLPVKRVCPHLQAEHRFDVCPSGCGALSGMLLERHGVPVTLFDLASNAFAQ